MWCVGGKGCLDCYDLELHLVTWSTGRGKSEGWLDSDVTRAESGQADEICTDLGEYSEMHRQVAESQNELWRRTTVEQVGPKYNKQQHKSIYHREDEDSRLSLSQTKVFSHPVSRRPSGYEVQARKHDSTQRLRRRAACPPFHLKEQIINKPTLPANTLTEIRRMTLNRTA